MLPLQGMLPLVARRWRRCVGVLALAALLAWPGGPAHAQDDDRVVARINGRALRLSEVYASIESLPLGDQIDVRDRLKQYIEAMVNEEVLFQYALGGDFAGDPELRGRVKQRVVNRLIEERVRSRVAVSDAEVRAYYDANPSLVRGEHVRVRKILRRERAECERLMAEIDSEEAFAEAAREHSLDAATAPHGGDAGLMMRGEGERTGYELEFFAMAPQEMRIFDVPEGCLLVRQVFHTNPPLPPFEAARDDLRRFLRNREEVRLLERLLDRAAREVPVERLYPEP